MASESTTPKGAPPRARSRERGIPSRPTTPLRPPSRASFRISQSTTTPGAAIGGGNNNDTGISGSASKSNSTYGDGALAALEPAFAEFADGMADLEANFMHLQLLHESLGRFNENFGSFLYGMNMSAFCVDFPEAPITQSFTRHRTNPQQPHGTTSPSQTRAGLSSTDADATFLTNDTSFVENPPPTSTSKTTASRRSVLPMRQGVGRGIAPGRGGVPGRGRIAASGGRIGRGAYGSARSAPGAGTGTGVGGNAGSSRGGFRGTGVPVATGAGRRGVARGAVATGSRGRRVT